MIRGVCAVLYLLMHESVQHPDLSFRKETQRRLFKQLGEFSHGVQSKGFVLTFFQTRP